MSKVPIEITCIGYKNEKTIENALYFLNNLQDSFNYSIISHEKFENYSKKTYITSEVFQLFNEILPKLKGFHPYVIGVIMNQLNGKEFTNLFGSMEEINNQITGKAITTLYEIKSIFKKIPIEIYLIFEFLSFSIRFICQSPLIHDEIYNCIFDRKISKEEIVRDIKLGKICDTCFKIVSNKLDNDQLYALRQIINEISFITNSKEPESFFLKQLNFIKNKTEKARSKVNQHENEGSKYIDLDQIHLILQEFSTLNTKIDRNYISIQLDIFCQKPSELSKYLKRIIKSNWTNADKDNWAKVIMDILENWKVLDDPRWQKVCKAIIDIAGELFIGDKVADFVSEGIIRLINYVKSQF